MGVSAAGASIAGAPAPPQALRIINPSRAIKAGTLNLVFIFFSF
jgi:hypothetical protein